MSRVVVPQRMEQVVAWSKTGTQRRFYRPFMKRFPRSDGIRLCRRRLESTSPGVTSISERSTLSHASASLDRTPLQDKVRSHFPSVFSL